MRCSKYYTLVILCISYCGFAICSTENEYVVTSSISDIPDSPAGPSDISSIPDISADDVATHTATALNEGRTATKIVKLPLDRGLVAKIIFSFLVAVMVTEVLFAMSWENLKAMALINPEGYHHIVLDDLPPANFSYYGSKDDLPKPNDIQKQAIKEINEVLKDYTIPVEMRGKIDLGTAKAVTSIDASILASLKDLRLEGRLMGERPVRAYLVTSETTGKKFEIRISNSKDTKLHKQLIANEKIFVKRLFEQNKATTDPFEMGAIMGQNLLLAEFDGTIPVISGAVQCKAFVYDAKKATLHELLKLDKEKKVLSMATKEFIAGRILLAAFHLAKSGHSHNGIKPKNVLLDEEGNIQFCGFQGVQIAGQKENIEFPRKTTSEPERYVAHSAHLSHLLYADPMADLYSVGSTIYYLYTGMFPYGECLKGKETIDEYFRDLVQKDTPLNMTPLEKAGVSEKWRELIRELLANTRAKRIKHPEIIERYNDILGFK